MTQVAIVLSGCGVFDGAEIHESVLTMLAITEQGATYQCFAPDKPQLHVINHLTGETSPETRNVLVESARIARGIQAIDQLNADDFDALIFPGGFGAAKNLCDFALNGQDCTIDPQVLVAAQAFAKANKPVGFICIAPAMIPKIFGNGVQLTIGTDQDTASAIEAMGGKHQSCDVEHLVIDKNHKVVSTPAYMLANNIGEAAKGIRALVSAVLDLTHR